MPEIKIDITNKVAAQIGTAVIVCGNDDYTVSFTFDNEWGAYQEKTARFRFTSAEGKKEYIDVLFSGSTCAVPILSNIDTVSVGVYAGDLQTTTGADIKCQRSILCGQGTKHEAPDPDVYNQILEACSQKLGSNGGTVTGDYYKDGHVFIHEGNLEKIDPHVQGLLDAGQYINAGNIDGHVQGLLDDGQYINPNNLGLIDDHTQTVDTATGSAISIESASAPLQNLKLYGRTTQDGTPTPEAPIELVSVGSSGNLPTKIFGRNLLEVTAVTQTINGVTFTVNADKSVTVKGTATATATFALNVNMRWNFITGQTYILTGANAFQIVNNNGAVSYVGANKPLTVTSDMKTINVYIQLVSGGTANTTFYPFVRPANIDYADYEPFKSYQNFVLNYALRSVGDIKDEIDFAKGVRIPRLIAKVLTGEEGANLVGTSSQRANLFGSNAFTDILAPEKDNTTIQVISSHFGELKTWQGISTSSDFNSFALHPNGTIGFAYNGTRDEANAWLKAQYQAGTPVTFICLVKSPQEIPLSETELNAYRQLMTNSGNTTILSEADAEATYYTNKPNGKALGAVHAQINRDYLKLQQAIIALGGSTL